MEKLLENEKALLWKVDMKTYHFFEVWIKIVGNSGKFRGQILNPTDEDFGIWAWCHYTEDGARKCFDEITEGTRQIRPMVEAV
jgi:hypothetical protein